MIHKVPIAAILDLFQTFTSDGFFALKSSVKLVCDPVHLPVCHSTSKLTANSINTVQYTCH